MFGFIAAKRNLALTTEKNDFLIFLGSNFLSINWRDPKFNAKLRHPNILCLPCKIRKAWNVNNNPRFLTDDSIWVDVIDKLNFAPSTQKVSMTAILFLSKSENQRKRDCLIIFNIQLKMSFRVQTGRTNIRWFSALMHTPTIPAFP